MKFLLYDIETFSHVASVWGKYDQNVIQFEEYGSIASVAYRWLGEKKTNIISRDEYSDKTDKALLKDFRKVLCEADYTLAHNGDEFDIKTINAHLVKHRLQPPSPTVQYDTKKIAKKYFRFPGNSLNDLAHFLGLGEKVKHEGFPMWVGCKKGDPAAWKMMRKYNAQDVQLLEDVYLVLRPWINRQPGLSLASEKRACDVCDGTRVGIIDYRFRAGKSIARYRCKDCGAWKFEKDKRAA